MRNNVVRMYGAANKYHEDLDEHVEDLKKHEPWSRERTQTVSIVAQIMAHPKVPMDVRDRAYRICLEYGSVAQSLRKYMQDKDKSQITMLETGWGIK